MKRVTLFAIIILAGVFFARQEPSVVSLSGNTFAEFDLGPREADYRRRHALLPRTIVREDFEGLTDTDNADRLITIGTLVYRHYTWANRPARFPTPPEHASTFADVPAGLCDGAARLINELLEGFEAESFNLVLPISLDDDRAVSGQNFQHGGHTVSQVKLTKGAALIDPTFGLMLLTSASEFTFQTFSSGDFKAFTLFDQPSDASGELSPWSGLWFYEHASLEPAYVGPAGDRIVATMPTLRIPSDAKLQVGVIDGSDRDMVAAFGGYANHIGYWYDRTRHVWPFDPEMPGRYEITFHIVSDGGNVVLKAPLDIEVTSKGAEVVELNRETEESTDRHVTISLDTDGPFSIEFESKTVSARLIDAVSVRTAVK